MGGNALKNVDVSRLPAAQYHPLAMGVCARLQKMTGAQVQVIGSFTDKPDFGDLDLLLSDPDDRFHDPDAWARLKLRVAEEFGAAGIFNNKTEDDVFSFDVGAQASSLPRVAAFPGRFQVDLIRTRHSERSFSYHYLSHNDMGNLFGVIARSLGFKLGSAGLLFPLRNANNETDQLAEIVVTRDFDKALSLIGYSPAAYRAAHFNSLEDIFKFVMTSRFARPELFLIEAFNHKGRVRNAKRSTYRQFGEWLNVTHPQQCAIDPAFRQAARDAALARALIEHPEFNFQREKVLEERRIAVNVRERFNGGIIGKATGVSGPPLGDLMARMRNSFASRDAFTSFVLHAFDREIEDLAKKLVIDMPEHRQSIARHR